MTKTTQPPLSWEVLDTFFLSSRIDVPPHASLDEIGVLLKNAPVHENGRRFEFGELDDSVCEEDEFLALVSWLFPLIPDDTAKKKDMAWAYGDGLAFGHESAAVWLIENGLDLKNVILDEGTALGFAASYNRPSIVRLLVEKDCDPNVFEKNGIPPLFEMIRNQGDPSTERAFLDDRAIETARLLIEAGAKREMTSGKKKIRDVDIAQGSLKKYLQWLDSGKEGVEIGEVVKPGTPSDKPKRRGP